MTFPYCGNRMMKNAAGVAPTRRFRTSRGWCGAFLRPGDIGGRGRSESGQPRRISARLARRIRTAGRCVCAPRMAWRRSVDADRGAELTAAGARVARRVVEDGPSIRRLVRGVDREPSVAPDT